MISCALAVPSTPMEFVSKLTEQFATPGTLRTAFSTRDEHAAQLMPVTLNCFMLCTSLPYPAGSMPGFCLFHQLL